MHKSERFFHVGKAKFRRNTLCISRKFDDVTRKKIRPLGTLSGQGAQISSGRVLGLGLLSEVKEDNEAKCMATACKTVYPLVH